MADAVASQTLFESAEKLVIKLTNVSDGTGESAVTKVDVSALSPAASLVAIDRIIAATGGMGVRILWDADTDVDAFLIPADQCVDIDFRCVEPGRLVNNAGTGVTGDIKFTTIGHSSGDVYSVILVCSKRALA